MRAYGIPKQLKRGVTDPPTKMTDPMTIRLVVVRKVCRAFDIVLRMAKAKAIAPRIPIFQSIMDEYGPAINI